MNPIIKKSAILGAAVIILDQAVKIWVKTHMFLGESSAVHWGWGIEWFQVAFTENPGMAFGLTLPGGKIFLSIFRIVAIAALLWSIRRLSIKENTRTGFVYCLALIASGAIGNLIDCMFYGLVFSSTGYTASSVAEFLPAAGGYAPFLQGKVVDMLHFPMITSQWPEWMPFCGGREFTFFSPIFNIADSAVTVGVFILVIFHKRYFPDEDQNKENASEEQSETKKGDSGDAAMPGQENRLQEQQMPQIWQ